MAVVSHLRSERRQTLESDLNSSRSLLETSETAWKHQKAQLETQLKSEIEQRTQAVAEVRSKMGATVGNLESEVRSLMVCTVCFCNASLE